MEHNIISSDAMSEAVRKMKSCLDDMDDYGEELIAALNAYSSVMQDNVEKSIRKIVKEIDAQVDEIKKTISAKTEKLSNVAAGIAAVEQDADKRG